LYYLSINFLNMSSCERYLYYFVSDVHLGLGAYDAPAREERFVKFLRGVPPEIKALYLLGDIFDYWFEYKYVVPKGFTRVLGALSQLSDSGVELYFFRGNHDMWTFGYLEKEIGLKILKEPSVVEIGQKKFCLAHGDELTGAEPSHLMLKKLFRSKVLQRLLASVHPRWTFPIASKWSTTRKMTNYYLIEFKGKEEPLYKYASEFEKKEKVDYFIFGHIHTPGDAITPSGAGFYILGAWLYGCEYLCYDSRNDKITWMSGG